MNATIVTVLSTPNAVSWLPWAVLYFFLIGLSVAAFTLSLPGLVFRRAHWTGLSRRALLGAVLCGVTAPLALLSDLHQPGRFLNFYLHSNFQSWMAWGAYFIPLYLAGLLLYAWLALRPTLAACGAGTGTAARWCARLAYGGHDSRTALTAAAALAGLGGVLVFLYTGMEVMVLRARPLWHTAMLPVLFVLTAYAGAVGMIHVLDRLLGTARAAATVRLNRLLVGLQLAILGANAAWLALGASGLSASGAQALAQLADIAAWRYAAAWAGFVTVVTLAIAWRRPQHGLLAGLLTLHSAWMIRWTVLIGGQGVSRLGEGYLAYSLPLGADGALGMIGIAGLWLALYLVLVSVLPWGNRAPSQGVQS